MRSPGPGRSGKHLPCESCSFQIQKPLPLPRHRDLSRESGPWDPRHSFNVARPEDEVQLISAEEKVSIGSSVPSCTISQGETHLTAHSGRINTGFVHKY